MKVIHIHVICICYASQRTWDMKHTAGGSEADRAKAELESKRSGDLAATRIIRPWSMKRHQISPITYHIGARRNTLRFITPIKILLYI